MDESDAWRNFTMTGSVADYLRYSAIKNSLGIDGATGDTYENYYGRSCHSRAELAGAGQNNYNSDEK